MQRIKISSLKPGDVILFKFQDNHFDKKDMKTLVFLGKKSTDVFFSKFYCIEENKNIYLSNAWFESKSEAILDRIEHLEKI